MGRLLLEKAHESVLTYVLRLVVWYGVAGVLDALSCRRKALPRLTRVMSKPFPNLLTRNVVTTDC